MSQVGPLVYERPAIPKRLTVIDVMPTTAIGKIYKPALRLRALETKLRELLSALAGDVMLEVKGEERGNTLVALVTLGAAHDATLEQRLRDSLAAIAVPVDIRFSG